MTIDSFGNSRRDWKATDHTGHELPELFTAPGSLDGLPEDQLDEILEFPSAISLRAGALYDVLDNDAQKLIVTAATNDAVALVTRTYALDGRSAAYAARALFEHLVNFHDVYASSTNTSERYTQHKYVTQKRIAEHRAYLELLSGPERQRAQKSLDQLAKTTEAPYEEAIRSYGNSFARQWAQGNLFERAKIYELEDGYEGYRILSSVIHGSSGALSGVTRTINGQSVHRAGPDLDLASLAWFEGLSAFYCLAKKIVDITGAWEAEEISDRTGNLLTFWPTVRAELKRLDNRMWPADAPHGPVAVAAFHPRGVRKWYYYSPSEETLILAGPPELEPDFSTMAELIAQYSPEEFNGRPLTVICEGVRVMPLRGQKPFPAAAMMVPKGHPARLQTQ